MREALSIPEATADVAQKVGFETILTTIDVAAECVLALGEAVPIVGKVFKLLAGLKAHFDQFLETEVECRRMSVWCVSMMSVLGKLVRDKTFNVDENCKQLLEAAWKSLNEMSDLVTKRVKSSSHWTGKMNNFLTTGMYAKEQSEAENHLNKAFEALSFYVQVNTREQVHQVLRVVQILPKMDQKLDKMMSGQDKMDRKLDEIQKQLANIQKACAWAPKKAPPPPPPRPPPPPPKPPKPPPPPGPPPAQVWTVAEAAGNAAAHRVPGPVQPRRGCV